MALIDAALAAAAPPSLSLSTFSSSSVFRSVSLLSKRPFPLYHHRVFNSITTIGRGGGDDIDIEDGFGRRFRRRKRGGFIDSLLFRFRMKRGLSVSDITSTEWCEKQMEFNLLVGRPEATKAMKAGSARHAVLEKEVVKRVKVQVRTVEDAWAIKIMNFLFGVNQLLSDGLTRELPLIGFVEGAWMVGVVDEIRMPLQESEKQPTFIDTKTRVQPTVPSEPQQRNGRLQLMCYKYLWDKLVSDNFPSRKFFDFFSLNRNSILSEEIRVNTTKLGFPAETLDDLVRYLRDSCSKLLPVHDQLVLRYELQKDLSLLREDKFEYNSDWVKTQIKSILELWLGEREAEYAPEEERWKCKRCGFASLCPINLKSDNRPAQD